jgi:hypothetical protein
MDKAEKIAAIVAVVQIFKYYGVPHKLLPIFAIILGALFEYSDNPTAQSILDGIVLGAMTTGSYGVLKGAAQSVLKIPKKDSIDTLEPDDDRCV